MLTVGTYLADRYEIVSKIGAGGMSDVYKAKDHVLGRFVAIKVLKPEFSEDRGFDTTHCKMEEYASKATDAQVKQFFQKSAQSAVDCKNQLMQYLQ